MKNIFILIAFIFILVSNLFPQETGEISTDRPDQTESPDIVPLKFIQFEGGIGYEKGGKNESGLTINNYSFPDLLIRYGVFKIMELRLHTQYVFEKNTSTGNTNNDNGILPVELHSKIKLFNGKEAIPATAVLLIFEIPGMASKNFKINHIQPEISFLFKNELSEKLDLSYNLGMSWNTDEKTRTGFYTLSLGISPAKKFNFFVESYSFFTKGVVPDFRIDYGAAYLLKKNMQIDVSSGFGLSDVSPDYFVGAGFSVRLPN